VCSSTSSERPSTGDATHGRGRRGFYAIAHRAGNNLHSLEEAIEAGVDAIECDFWHSRGRLVLRHERKLPLLPVLFDRWHLRFALGELSLRDLLREINFRTELFLDIKSATPRAADAVVGLCRDLDAMMPRTQVSSPRWKLLDRIAAAGAGMRLFYSIGDPRAVEPLLRRAAAGDRRPAGTSIRHTLLRPRLVERFHAAGLEVYAWTVNDAARARELLSWRVDGIISDDMAMFDGV